MAPSFRHDEVFGFLRPGVDAHTLGISAVEQLLADTGYGTVTASAEICAAANGPRFIHNVAILEKWIRTSRITRLGFSYRLDPNDGARTFGRLLYARRERRLLGEVGGPVQAIYFAGFPDACRKVASEHGGSAEVFYGDETPRETLEKLGVPDARIQGNVAEHTRYDKTRMEFAESLLASGSHEAIRPVDRSGCSSFGTRQDCLVDRVRHGRERGLPPLMRAHVGPYGADREEAVRLFMDWTRRLARSGFLDVLSIGSSQLTQSHFGQDWTGLSNGGGVPINSPEEFRRVRDAASPMLVRTYAGTRNVPLLARINEETLNIAWHALSFWWFSQIDGRGPNSVEQNLREHVETLRYIASTGKPFEPNVPHHFAFRGADDVTYVVSAVLAARTAKAMGVRDFVLQIMLNTPKRTWGVQELAKARAALSLVRSLEDSSFHVMLQPRAGLDYLSHDLGRAKAQLAAVSALMDDIEPDPPSSPDIVHVVSYSEGSHLADPDIVYESIRITRAAIVGWRTLREAGEVEDMGHSLQVRLRTQKLVAEALDVLNQIEHSVEIPYSAQGLYTIFRAGFLPVPWLWEGREEFAEAVRWSTRVERGSVVVVDESGRAIRSAYRAARAAEVARELQSGRAVVESGSHNGLQVRTCGQAGTA